MTNAVRPRRAVLPVIIAALSLTSFPRTAPADTAIYATRTILTGLQDLTNVGFPNPTFPGTLSKPAGEPDLYINSINFIPGPAWDPLIVLTTPSELHHGGDGSPYQLGTPIVGEANWNIDIITLNGAVDAAVIPGVYDFSVDFVGGADPAATDTLASIPLQLEVFPAIHVSATGVGNPDPVNPGQETEVSVTLTNNMPDRAFVLTTWYTYVPGFNGPAGAGLADYDFAGNWFGVVVDPGQSHTDLHSRWRTLPGHPGGTYTARLGIYGGLHEGDFFEIAADATLTLTGGPAIAGDANFSGLIDSDDFALLDRGFASALLGWSNGDFNQDGVIDQFDYLLLDQSFAAQQGGALSPDFLLARQSRFGPAYTAQLLAAIPEPSALLTACALALLPLTHPRRLSRA